MKDLFCLFMSPYTYIKVINATQSTTVVGPWHLSRRGYQCNQKLLHHYQDSKNQRNS